MTQCIGCREEKHIVSFDRFPLCAECAEWDNARHEILIQDELDKMTCELCGYCGVAIEKHHIDGRKNSDRIIKICSNCHLEIHKGARELEDG